jgi:hypothetical protein
MFDAFLAISTAVAATVYLSDWFAGEAPNNLVLAAWNIAFSLYAFRVHRLKRRLSERHVGELLKTLREVK